MSTSVTTTVTVGGVDKAAPRESAGLTREIGSQAVWSLSSCKAGYGVEQLRDGALDTYWQSDGPQPHLVNIQFQKKTEIEMIQLYADFKQDESYTPESISIRIGNNFDELREIEQLKLSEPSGWIPVHTKTADGYFIKTFMVQIAILTNHQNGRDTHVRQIKIYSPRKEQTLSDLSTFSSIEYSMYQTIR